MRFNKVSLNEDWDFNIEPSLRTVYKVRAKLGRKTTEFDVSHELLCKYNGVLPIGTLPSDYPQRDCKEIDFCNIEFVALEKRESENFKQKYRVVKHFRCEHEEECSKKSFLSEEGSFEPRRSSSPSEGARPRESEINS